MSTFVPQENEDCSGKTAGTQVKMGLRDQFTFRDAFQHVAPMVGDFCDACCFFER